MLAYWGWSLSFKIVEMGVVAPKWFIMEVLRDKATVLSLLPAGLLEPLDPSYDRVRVRFRWAFFSLQGVYTVSVREVDDRTILYVFESEGSRMVVRFVVIEGGVTVSKFYAGFEWEGLALSRVALGLRPRLVRWMEALREYIETEARRRGVIEKALKAQPPARAAGPAQPPVQSSAASSQPSQPAPARAPQERPAASPGPQAPSQPAPKPATPIEIERGSERLVDPLFEAEILIKGRVVLVDNILLTKVADVIDRMALEGKLDPGKSYVAKISLGDAEATILIENSRLAGAVYREQGKTLKALEALESLQKRLPAQAHVTVIEI
jgi:hypothetical protein